jgi:flavin reductase (DIM6/NTAB) family NADH-FMN oxidoreductase RutF
MFYEPKNGHGLPHDPFRAIVAPRPIGWISTISADGHVNLAPYSFFNAFSGAPPLVGFASEGNKHSASNALETGEFVFNLATRAMAEAVNKTSTFVDREVDEFDYADVERAECRLVRPPRVRNAPASLECRTTGTMDLVDIDGAPTDRRLVVGQVIGVHIDENFLTDGLFDVVKAGTISRLGYRDYAQVTELFSMRPPPAVLDH